MKIGYARVSTEDQNPDLQLSATTLRARRGVSIRFHKSLPTVAGCFSGKLKGWCRFLVVLLLEFGAGGKIKQLLRPAEFFSLKREQ